MEGHGGGIEHETWLHFFYTKHILPDWIPEMVPVTWFIILLLGVVFIAGTRRLKLRDPGRFQAFLELVVTSLENFVRNIAGNEAKTLTPTIGSFFIFILTLNLFGLIPGFMAPTSNFNTTIALALFAFLLVQFYGFRRLGFRYVLHFWGDPWWLGPLMFPIHVIGELARPLSLSVRLFGNIFGEETTIAVLMLIVTSVLGHILIPIQFPMLLFAIFGSFIQAMVFSMLTSIYIAVAVSGHEEEH